MAVAQKAVTIEGEVLDRVRRAALDHLREDLRAAARLVDDLVEAPDMEKGVTAADTWHAVRRALEAVETMDRLGWPQSPDARPFNVPGVEEYSPLIVRDR